MKTKNYPERRKNSCQVSKTFQFPIILHQFSLYLHFVARYMDGKRDTHFHFLILSFRNKKAVAAPAEGGTDDSAAAARSETTMDKANLKKIQVSNVTTHSGALLSYSQFFFNFFFI